MKLTVMPNHMPHVELVERHVLPLPQCCPVSGNPQSGSTISIIYKPNKAFLEVYHLQAYLNKFVGGFLDNATFIRDMEQLVQKVALDCANSLSVQVNVNAKLFLQNSQKMYLRAKAHPQSDEIIV